MDPGQVTLIICAVITALGVVCSLVWRIIRLVTLLVDQHRSLMVEMRRVLDRLQKIEQWRARRDRRRS